MWCYHCNCVHTFRLNFGDPLCSCSVLTYFPWHTGLWIGVTILVVIQQSWVQDQGLRNKTWIIFYYDCISILKLSEARMYCLMYIFSYMILSFFLMVSESPGCDNPCGISKAFLSTAFGLRLSIIFCFAWLGWILLWVRTKDGSVPGCATRTSVTPLVGEQPWMSVPRYCYPRSKWSMMSSLFSKTFYLKGFYHCFFIWTYDTFSAILLTTKSLSLRKATTCQLLETNERAFLQIKVFQITIIVVIFSFWSFVQPNILWHFPVYFVLFIQHMASEAIRFSRPYATSKANY